MYTSGEKPGKGLYQCTNCGEIVTLETNDDALPICPVCGNDSWNRVR